MKWKQSGDKELWALSGERWKYPFFCTPGTVGLENVWRVIYALPLPVHISRSVADVLHGISFGSIRDFRFINDKVFSKTFTKCPGITPEYYVQNEDHINKPLAHLEFTRKGEISCALPPEGESFVQSVWAKTKIADLATFKIVWGAMCQEMPSWVLERRSPLNLGWGVIHAFPFRSNWKQILLSKYPRIWSWLSTKSTWDSLYLGSFYSDFIRTDMLSVNDVDKCHSINWTIELTPTKRWSEISSKYETAIAKTIPPENYSKRIAELVAASWGSAMASFYAFVKTTGTPCGDIVENDEDSTLHLVPAFRFSRINNSDDSNLDVAVVSRLSSERLNGLEDKKDVEAAKAKMLSLSDVRDSQQGSDNDELREPGGDDHWDKYAAGLLV